ncbi:hypothetical protein CGRA01v4_12743 [Colletotrichum graminicola]|nr:hypothetical protein CGRA01v4_12743 [Colletotrichum graminicola]
MTSLQQANVNAVNPKLYQGLGDFIVRLFRRTNRTRHAAVRSREAVSGFFSPCRRRGVYQAVHVLQPAAELP